MHRVPVALLSLALALLAALPAGAAIERVRVRDSGREETRVFPPDVYVSLETPASYTVRTPGSWAGPTFWPEGRPDQPAQSGMDWKVSFRDRAQETAPTALGASAFGWPEDQKAGISVPLYAGGRLVGTLPGYFVLRVSPGPEKARFEAVAAIPLGSSVQAVVRFVMASPAADASPWGNVLVQGAFLASSWNRGQALIALSQVHVEGNLAPKTLSIRADRKPRALRGRVVDDYLNPLVGVSVVQERWNGVTWKAVRVGKTNATGRYLMAAGKGRYRTVVSNAGVTVTSAPALVR